MAQLRQEIAETERQVEMAQENFEKISRLIKREVEAFDIKKAQDFKASIVAYLVRERVPIRLLSLFPSGLFLVRQAVGISKSISHSQETMLSGQEKIAAEWERYLPEIQRVNHNISTSS